MDEGQRERIRQLLFQLHFWEQKGQRTVFLGKLFRGSDLWLDLRYDGTQGEAADSLVALCEPNAAKRVRGESAVCALLRGLRTEYEIDAEACIEIDRLLAALCASPAARPRSSWQGEPYRGLAYFDRRHAPIFFGRESELQELITALTTDQGGRFLIVMGASGSGKSSLVRAGVWASLADGRVPEMPGPENWLVAAMTPTDLPSPMLALQAATIAAAKERDGFEDLLDFAWGKAFDDIESGASSLADVAQCLLEHRPGARWLLILDQMEELFTSVDKAHREAFIEQLINATKPPTKDTPPKLQVLATMRADFFHHCVAHPSLRSVVDRGGKFLLGPPDRLSLERMVTGPLTEVDLVEKDLHGNSSKAHWTVDPKLPPRIAAAASDREGGLALMAFALRELYDRCKDHRYLDLATYQSQDFGELGGVISRRAETVLEQFDEGEVLFGQVFNHLVSVSADHSSTRRRARLSTWDDEPRALDLVRAFVEARLLVTNTGEGQAPTVEVAHEALLREWPKLVSWIATAGEALRLRDRAYEEARLWVRKGRPDAPRWRHEVLDPARGLLAKTGLLKGMEDPQRNPDTADFLTPEANWLLAELLCGRTDHARREIIGMRLSEIGDPRQGVGLKDGVPDILWCDIDARKGEVEIEGHGHFAVAPFRMAAYPVTYAQYRAFIDADDGYRSEVWWDGLEHAAEPGIQLRRYPSYPADYVSWHDATAFCRWLSKKLGYAVRLADEWEWQWAAQSGPAGFVYPWGPQWQEGLANTEESGIARTTAVGMYPVGRNRQGVYDLAGNVWEWCRNSYENPRDREVGGEASRVLRGGSWIDVQDFARADNRRVSPDGRGGGHGFRVVCGSHIQPLPSGYRPVAPTTVCAMRWKADGWCGYVPSACRSRRRAHTKARRRPGISPAAPHPR